MQLDEAVQVVGDVDERPAARPATAEASARTIGLLDPVPGRWALAGAAGWLVLYAVLTWVEPPAPADLSPPWLVEHALSLAGLGLMVAFAGFGMRARLGFVASGITALLLLGTTSWCATHLGFGAVLGTQVSLVSAMALASLVAATRR